MTALRFRPLRCDPNRCQRCAITKHWHTGGPCPELTQAEMVRYLEEEGFCTLPQLPNYWYELDTPDARREYHLRRGEIFETADRRSRWG